MAVEKISVDGLIYSATFTNVKENLMEIKNKRVNLSAFLFNLFDQKIIERQVAHLCSELENAARVLVENP